MTRDNDSRHYWRTGPDLGTKWEGRVVEREGVATTVNPASIMFNYDLQQSIPSIDSLSGPGSFALLDNLAIGLPPDVPHKGDPGPYPTTPYPAGILVHVRTLRGWALHKPRVTCGCPRYHHQSSSRQSVASCLCQFMLTLALHFDGATSEIPTIRPHGGGIADPHGDLVHHGIPAHPQLQHLWSRTWYD